MLANTCSALYLVDLLLEILVASRVCYECTALLSLSLGGFVLQQQAIITLMHSLPKKKNVLGFLLKSNLENLDSQTCAVPGEGVLDYSLNINEVQIIHLVSKAVSVIFVV